MTYPYWHQESKSFHFQGMMDALQNRVEPGSVVLLQACAHNPTGIDPTRDQWKQIGRVMQEKHLIPVIDLAYQGYASGDVDEDAWSCRYFMSLGLDMFVCQSFSKNLGLYGERVGMVHVLCPTEAAQKAVSSQLKMQIRPMYSNPPKHGALIVMKILGNEQRMWSWKQELNTVAASMQKRRALLQKGLEEKGAPGKWHHLTEQIGMFAYTGLSERVCARMIQEHHIYLVKETGRISVPGVNPSNVDHIVDSIDEAIRFFQ